jgi:hypothetical protein
MIQAVENEHEQSFGEPERIRFGFATDDGVTMTF